MDILASHKYKPLIRIALHCFLLLLNAFVKKITRFIQFLFDKWDKFLFLCQVEGFLLLKWHQSL